MLKSITKAINKISVTALGEAYCTCFNVIRDLANTNT